MLCKTEWSWELRTRSHQMNLLDILSTSPLYFCRKWIAATNGNSNFDLGPESGWDFRETRPQHPSLTWTNSKSRDEHILLITMLTIKSLSTIDSLKKKTIPSRQYLKEKKHLVSIRDYSRDYSWRSFFIIYFLLNRMSFSLTKTVTSGSTSDDNSCFDTDHNSVLVRYIHSMRTGTCPIYTFFYIRLLFFRPRLNFLIFLPILGWKYSSSYKMLLIAFPP